MKKLLSALLAAATVACNAGTAPPAALPSMRNTSTLAEVDSHYRAVLLVSDGYIGTKAVDPNLQNVWGLVASATSPWWIANNGTGTSSLYDGQGRNSVGLPFINVPSEAGGPGSPTGIVFSGRGFVVSAKGKSGPARFIFASEDGVISGWNPATDFRNAIAVAHGANRAAVYKGLAIATTPKGDRLFATDFSNATIDVFDDKFAWLHGTGFADPEIPPGFAPFGIRTIGDLVYVTYAKQDTARHDSVAGEGFGYVSAFDLSGNFVARIASGEKLNAPWGIAQAPASGFGRASGKLLIGNFGDGHILALDQPKDGEQDEGQLLEDDQGEIVIDGLWGISFGFGNTNSGPTNSLYFAAGPRKESHGLFGFVEPVAVTEE